MINMVFHIFFTLKFIAMRIFNTIFSNKYLVFALCRNCDKLLVRWKNLRSIWKLKQMAVDSVEFGVGLTLLAKSILFFCIQCVKSNRRLLNGEFWCLLREYWVYAQICLTHANVSKVTHIKWNGEAKERNTKKMESYLSFHNLEGKLSHFHIYAF